MSETKKQKNPDKKKQKQKQEDDDGGSDPSRRNLWIALAILVVLAVIAWYLYDRGYLQRWFSGMGKRSSAGRRQNFSPSAPPFEGNF